MGEIDLKANLQIILGKIEEAKSKRPPEFQIVNPLLVAVSKTKPANMIVGLYEEGQRHFGENYVQELESKGSDPIILEKCNDIKWHLIGHLQSNKINKVLSVPNIYMIETVDSQKLATNLNKKWPEFRKNDSKLNVMVQINTSGEKEKSGIHPDKAENLTKFILDSCDNLHLDGFMTIGEYGYNPDNGPNPDFVSLRKCRDNICKNLGIEWSKMNLSMGMSTDYEHAIELGSTRVRVGSSIFGYRPPKN